MKYQPQETWQDVLDGKPVSPSFFLNGWLRGELREGTDVRLFKGTNGDHSRVQRVSAHPKTLVMNNQIEAFVLGSTLFRGPFTDLPWWAIQTLPSGMIQKEISLTRTSAELLEPLHALIRNPSHETIMLYFLGALQQELRAYSWLKRNLVGGDFYNLSPHRFVRVANAMYQEFCAALDIPETDRRNPEQITQILNASVKLRS